MELRPISDGYLDGKPLPSIQDQMSKKQAKNVDVLSKLSSPDRLQAMLKSNRKVPPVKDQSSLTAISNAENNVGSNGQNTPLYGDPETQKVELLREGYFRAKSRADEYLLLVAAEKETLTSRGWVPGNGNGNGDSAAADLYSFKSKSAEKKQQYHQANRLYYGLSTLLYASIGAMKANELDVYVRRKALLLPGSIFDIKEWEQFLTLAKDCRSKEWRDGEITAAATVSIKAEEGSNKANLKSSLKKCMECLRSLRLDSEGMTDEVQDSTKEFGRYMIGAKKKIEEAMLKLGKTLIETKKSYQAALAALEVEKEKNRRLVVDVDERVRLDVLMRQDNSEDKMKLQKDEYEADLREKENEIKEKVAEIKEKEAEIKEKEAEINEKESQRLCLSRENEDLAALGEKSSIRQQILETRLALLETSHAENLLRLKRYENAPSEKGGFPAIKIAGMTAENKSSDEPKVARHITEAEKENFKKVKDRVAQLEGELEVAQKRHVSVIKT
jgi:hypothetical protein